MTESLIYKSIGIFCVEFELMCQEMESCIEDILDHSGLKNKSIINVILADKTAEPLRGLMFALVAEILSSRSEHEDKLLQKCNNTIQDLIRNRNEIIHTKWLIVSTGQGINKTPYALGMKLKAGRKGDITEFSANKTEEFDQAIQKCVKAQQIVKRISMCIAGINAIDRYFELRDGELLLKE